MIKQAKSEKRTAVGYCADVRDLSEVETMVERVQHELGEVDTLVNNAGTNSTPGPMWEADPADWWQDIATNVLGPYHVCRTVVPQMLRRGRGRIINIVGAGAQDSWPYLSSYGSSKAALLRFTETVDLEAAKQGVLAFALDPGLVRSPGMEQMIAEGVIQQWLPAIMEMFEQAKDVHPKHISQFAVEVAAGRLDELHGCWFNFADTVEDLLSRKDEILQKDLRKLKLVNSG